MGDTSEVRSHVQREAAAKRPSGGAPVAASGRDVQLKKSVRAADGFEAQSAMLAPVQMMGGWLDIMGTLGGGKSNGAGGKKVGGAVTTPGDKQPGGAEDKQAEQKAGPEQKAGAEQKDGAEQKTGAEQKQVAPQKEAAAKKDAVAPMPTDLPRDFGSESALRAWIELFNISLATKMTAVAKKSWITKLKGKEWGDDNGLNYEMLAVAAAKQPAPSPDGKKKDAASTPIPQPAPSELPAPVSNAKILAMLSAGNQGLFGGIAGYGGLCLQFSAKIMEQMGAKRVDGSGAKTEKATSAKGPLTALYRGLRMHQVPKELPPGYQICVVSKPDWGFTEVGNHWFISAGDGFYLDDVMGVTNGAQMEESLLKTTAEQWARRVVGAEQTTSLRKRMGAEFVKANPSVEAYHTKGRTLNQQAKTLGKDKKANADYKDADATELEGMEKVRGIVRGARSTYAPRVWVIEPTTKVDGGQ